MLKWPLNKSPLNKGKKNCINIDKETYWCNSVLSCCHHQVNDRERRPRSRPSSLVGVELQTREVSPRDRTESDVSRPIKPRSKVSHWHNYSAFLYTSHSFITQDIYARFFNLTITLTKTILLILMYMKILKIYLYLELVVL